MKFDANQVMILELAQRVLRSWWTVIAGLAVGLAAAVIVLHYTPKVYQASTVIYAAPQRIPREYINVPVPDDLDVRLGSLQQSVLSGPYLERLLNTTFAAPASQEEKALLIQSIRRRVEIRAARRDRFFEIRFLDTDPIRAARVVNTLAQFYIEANTRSRADRADDTTRTMEELADEAQKELDLMETEISSFEARYVNELSEQLEVNMSLLRGQRDELASTEKSLDAARSRYELLLSLRAQGVSLSPVDFDSAPSSGGDGGGLATEIATLEREIDALLRRYSRDHPDVKSKQRQLDELRERAGIDENVDDEEPPFDPSSITASSQDLEILEAKGEVQRLETRRARIRQSIDLYEGRISRTPQRQQELDALSKDLKPLQDRYDSLRRKVEDAKNAQIVEESQRGNQFEVIDLATPPTLPVKPNPQFLYMVGMLIGLGVFVGPMVLLHFLRPVVGSEASIRSLAEVPLLISIPNLDPVQFATRIRRRWFTNVFLSVFFCAVLVAAWYRFH